MHACAERVCVSRKDKGVSQKGCWGVRVCDGDALAAVGGS